MAGPSGSFLLQDAGTLDGNIVRGDWFVVLGSGTGGLAGLRGEGGFRANLGEGAQVHLGLLVRMNAQVFAAAVARQPAPGKAADRPVTLVLSRTVRAGHERAFEDALHRLAAEVRRQPGHLAVAILTPPPGGPRIYTMVSHFATEPDADAWLSSPTRARLVTEAGLHASGELKTRYVSGLEAWLTGPGSPVVVAPARWRTVVVSAAALLPLLEVISYLLAPRLVGVPAWARPLISVVIVIPLMQYVVMPALARAARGFLYPRPASEAGEGQP